VSRHLTGPPTDEVDLGFPSLMLQDAHVMLRMLIYVMAITPKKMHSVLLALSQVS
jgi:hypothetical protein